MGKCRELGVSQLPIATVISPSIRHLEVTFHH